MRTLFLTLAALAALAGCDDRAAQVERCVSAYVRDGIFQEGPARVACMRAAYGHS